MINTMSVVAPMTYNVNGALRFDKYNLNFSSTNLNNLARRSTRTATLDGSAVLYDTGHSVSDRIVILAFYDSDASFSDYAKTVVEDYEKVWLFLNDGAYIANPKSYNIRRGNVVMTLEVIESA